VQFLGAMNDNVFKQALVILLAYQTASFTSMSSDTLQNLAQALFILPFFLFSALAGQLADDHDKARLIRIIKLAEIGIMILGGSGIMLANIPLMLAAVGLMGVVADAALAAGGEVIGIIPQSLKDSEIGHSGLTRLEVVDGMHARKARMAELSDGFIAMPGGLGTLEELFEIWTWAQLGYHRKPLGLLDVNGFYSKLSLFLDHLVAEEFVKPKFRNMLQRSDNPDALLKQLNEWQPELSSRWQK